MSSARFSAAGFRAGLIGSGVLAPGIALYGAVTALLVERLTGGRRHLLAAPPWLRPRSRWSALSCYFAPISCSMRLRLSAQRGWSQQAPNVATRLPSRWTAIEKGLRISTVCT